MVKATIQTGSAHRAAVAPPSARARWSSASAATPLENVKRRPLKRQGLATAIGGGGGANRHLICLGPCCVFELSYRFYSATHSNTLTTADVRALPVAPECADRGIWDHIPRGGVKCNADGVTIMNMPRIKSQRTPLTGAVMRRKWRKLKFEPPGREGSG